jgi:hypothetical protein
MEAVKEFPSENYVTLNFAENKVYKSVKTDILKRLMWFAPQTEIGGEWLSLPVSEVREFQELNKKGEFPVLEVQEKKSLKPEKVELEFKNDMGIGSLTRLDEKDRRRNTNQRNKNKSRNTNNPNFNGPKPNQNSPQNLATAENKTIAATEPKIPSNNQKSMANRPINRPKHNNRPNRNPNQEKTNNQNPS